MIAVSIELEMMDAIHVINLDRSPGRMDAFVKRNSHLTNVVRVSAIDGRSIGRESLVASNIIRADLNYTAGSLGCAASHISLWQKAVEQQRPFTIAEDDAVFSHGFEHHVGSLLAGLRPDWDFILWSASLRCYAWLDALPGGVGARLEFFSGAVLENLDKFQTEQTEPALLRARHSLGLICYSVSPGGAQALLTGCLPLRPMVVDFKGFDLRLDNTGIDCATNLVMPSLRAYVCLPPLVISDERERSDRAET